MKTRILEHLRTHLNQLLKLKFFGEHSNVPDRKNRAAYHKTTYVNQLHMCTQAYNTVKSITDLQFHAEMKNLFKITKGFPAPELDW